MNNKMQEKAEEIKKDLIKYEFYSEEEAGKLVKSAVLAAKQLEIEEAEEPMSYYTAKEICGNCQFAVFFDCYNCLKECKVNAKKDRNFLNGFCKFFRKG